MTADREFLLLMTVVVLGNFLVILYFKSLLYRTFYSPKPRQQAKLMAWQIVRYGRWYINHLEIVENHPREGDLFLRLASFNPPRQTVELVLRKGHPDRERIMQLPKMTILQASFEETNFVPVLGFEPESYLRFAPTST